MQTMHHLPTPNTILTNHTPLTKSPYQPPAFNVNVEPQHNTFPITLHNTHVEPSPLSIMSTPIVPMIKSLNLPPSSQHAYNLHLKLFALPMDINLPFKG
jgi:hypothetical protein